jgi:pimeloyl-[acyl-carrier protein] synthase
MSPMAMAVDDPYTTLAFLREHDPVHWDERGMWVLTRYADVADALRDPRWRRHRAGDDQPPEWGVDPDADPVLARMFLFLDPPDHTRLRGLVNRAFTPSAITALEPRIATLVDELLDGWVGRDAVDVVGELAVPLPATVIAELVGVPAADLSRFKRWSDDFGALIDMVPGTDWLALGRSVGEFARYLRELAAERRAHPRHDLLTGLVAREAEGLTEDELVGTTILLIAAGHETTTNLIANGVWLLLRHPEAAMSLRAEPSGLPAAIEEILRFEPPVQLTTRLAGERIVLGGRTIEPGQEALLSLAAANRDPAAFSDPDRFDITRTPNRHLGFGTGAHFCIGSPLARLEGRIALGRILARFPDLRAAHHAAADWSPSIVFRALASLPVRPA